MNVKYPHIIDVQYILGETQTRKRPEWADHDLDKYLGKKL